MGAQTLMLRQKTQALEATLTKTLEEGGPFGWLK